jgi:site-specific recombinase XerD
MFNFLVGRIGLVTLSQVEYRHMVAFQKWLSEPQVVKGRRMHWSPSTVNRAFHSIKDFFMFWVRNGTRADSPCQHLKNLPEGENTRRPMEDFEFCLVRESSPDWFKPVVEFMHLTASAPSSIGRFTWRDVNFENGSIIITRRKGKEAKWRRIAFPMIDELRALLVAQKERHGAQPDRHVFLNEHGKPLTGDWCSKVGNRAIKKAGLKGLQLYGIRHALASELTDANVSMEVIRQLMGHANIRTTQRYTKPKTDTLATALTLVRGENLPPNVPPKNECERLGGTGS